MNENGETFGKIFGFALLMLSIIAGIYAVVRPMQQSIDGLQRQIDQNKETQLRHDLSDSHVGTIEEIAGIRERFKEIETQFKAFDSRIGLEVRLLTDSLSAKASALEQALRAEANGLGNQLRAEAVGLKNALEAEAKVLNERIKRDEQDINELRRSTGQIVFAKENNKT